MRIAKVLTVSLMLSVGPVSAAFAIDPDPNPSDANQTQDPGSPASEAPPASADTAPAAAPSDQPAAETAQPATDPAQPSPDPAQNPPDGAQPSTADKHSPTDSQQPAANAQNSPPATAPAVAAPQPDAAPGADTAHAAPAPAATPPPAAAAASAPPAAPNIVANDRLLYLPVAEYIQTYAKKDLGGTNAEDRQTLSKFYTDRMGSALWVDKNGYNADAKSIMSALRDADSYGLRSADFKIPELKANPDGSFNQDDLTAAETRLSLEAMEYARDARGDRISDPSAQLGTYLDRKPQLVDRKTLLDALVAAPDKGAYLASLNPQQDQFRKLREKLIALRSSKKEAEALIIPDGKLLKPGMSDPQIAILRKRLKIADAPMKDDGTAADENFYDKKLGEAVQAYKASKGIRPETASVSNTLRRSLNSSNDVSEADLIANMEEWRWMPSDLGNYYIMVNIPEFKFRVVSDGKIIHEERIVSGRPDAQSPIFSETMKTVVIQPRWNVPDSIKIKELLPGLRSGADPLRRQGLVMEYNGRKVDPYNVNWSRTDIRTFNVYQPPGGGNALGVVKFLFPNKHAVYLHDTPSKSLFNEPVRAFSHGCMRVRNPVTLAELILGKDKGWDKEKVDDLVKNGPEENEVNLDHPVPVHVTYFTAWANDDGQVQTFDDVYGHEKRITLALAGRWNQIVKADEKKVSPEDIPDEGWGNNNFSSLFGDDDDYDDRGRRRHRNGGLGNFFKQVFGGY